MDKKTMYKLTYGLFVLTAAHQGKSSGCIINTATQVTSDPNRVSIAVNKANFTQGLVADSGRFNLSILSQASTFDTFQHFGFQSGRDVDKFTGYPHWAAAANGLPYVTAGTNGFISAAVEQAIDLGSHTLFIARVEDAKVLSDDPSVSYAYYQAHIKPQPEAPKAPAGKTQWRCTVCGYVYEGDTLPEDFICPWCKHPASDFEKVSG
jgi:flavin reductase (DIM6/NTAB) family NADH-FMN oxidoreductase RutF/rubredoxin